MASINPTQEFESLVRTPADFPYDATITAIFEETVHVRPVGSATVKRNVAIPSHIKNDITDNKLTLKLGQPVRLTEIQGKPALADVFPYVPEAINYAGLGTGFPDPPDITVTSTKDGWLIEWQSVNGADRYCVYRNDTPDLTTPDKWGEISETSVTVPYESPYIYFAVSSISGLNESEVSGWLTDEEEPLSPTITSHEFQPGGHYIVWSTNTPANEIEEFVIYRNTSAADAGKTEVDRVSSDTNNYTIPYGASGDYFAVSAIDYAGNESDLTWSSEYDPTPTTPGNFTVQLAEIGGWVASWDEVATALRYEVEGAEDAGGTNNTSIWQGDALTMPIHRSGDITHYRVRAIGYDGSSASNWTSWQTDNNAPPQPVIRTTNSADYITVALDSTDTSHSAVGFSHYKLEDADDDSGTGSSVIDSEALLSEFPYSVNYPPRTIKYFRLTPYDIAGNAGTSSNWTKGQTVPGEDSFYDKFNTYGGTTQSTEEAHWLKIADMDQDETWDSHSSSYIDDETTNHLDGDGAKVLHYYSSAPLEQGSEGGGYYPYHLAYNDGLNGNYSSGSPLDLSTDYRWQDSTDKIVLVLHHPDLNNLNIIYAVVQIRLEEDDSNYFYFGDLTYTETNSNGWLINFLRRYDGIDWNEETIDIAFPKSDAKTVGSPSWNSITGARVIFYNVDQDADLIIDGLYIVKVASIVYRDPTQGVMYNTTGGKWAHIDLNDTGHALDNSWEDEIRGDTWLVNDARPRDGEPTSQPYTLAHYRTVPYADEFDMSYLPNLYAYSGSVQAGIMFHKSITSLDPTAGLIFFVKETIVEALIDWLVIDGYAVEANINTGEIALVKFDDGVRTSLKSTTSFSFSQGEELYLGADFSDFDADGGRIRVYASKEPGDIIKSENMLFSHQDTSFSSGGAAGVYTNANTRFFDFRAGSPGHAKFSDISGALKGPIISGDKMVRYSYQNDLFEKSSDGGVTWANVVPPVRTVSSLPATGTPGEMVLLKVDPIFSCSLNGNPSNGATTLTVDNVTTGAETDTLVGHHLFRLDANGNRVDEGQISDTGSTNTLNVEAKNWADDGWTDDDIVEVGARDSLWYWAEGRWKCNLLDRIYLTGDTDISHASSSWSTTLTANIILPTTMEILAIGNMNSTWAYSGSNNAGPRIGILVDGGTRIYGGWQRDYEGSSGGAHGAGFGQTRHLAEFASGSHKFELQWSREFYGTIYNNASSDPDWGYRGIQLEAYAL